MLKTKIVCTLGPATNSPRMIEQMIECGMNVARINFSHGSHAEHKKTIDNIKAARERLGRPVAIMLDTKGPEVRIGKFRDGEVELPTGAHFTLTTDDIVGDATRVSVSYRELPNQLKPGSPVLVDDGNIELSVESCTENEVHCE